MPDRIIISYNKFSRAFRTLAKYVINNFKDPTLHSLQKISSPGKTETCVTCIWNSAVQSYGGSSIVLLDIAKAFHAALQHIRAKILRYFHPEFGFRIKSSTRSGNRTHLIMNQITQEQTVIASTSTPYRFLNRRHTIKKLCDRQW